MSWTYTDTADQVIAVTECTTELVGVHIGINAWDGRSIIVCIPADKRRAAAQALAGPDYRVVPADDTAQAARDQRDRLTADVGRILDAHGPAAIARAKADALHAFADTMDRLPDDWVLIRRDYGSEVTVEDLLRQTADRYVEQPYPILTQIRVDPKQPDRPEPVDPAGVRVWDVVEVEGDDWMVRGPVVDVDDPNADGPRYSPDRPVGIRFGPHMAWPNVSDATVRVLHAAEPEPDPDAVEAMEVALANVGIYAPHDAALRLIRDHGVRVEVPDAD